MSDVTAPPSGYNPDKSLAPRECPACRRTFTPYRKFQRACSKHCRERLSVNPDDLMAVRFTCVTRGKEDVGYTTGGGGRFKYCGDCQSQAQRRVRDTKNANRRLRAAEDPGVWRDRLRRQQIRRYGIEWERYEEMLAAQNGVCAICERPPSGKGTSGQRLHVDHDHGCCPVGRSCGACVRGLLCSSCNRAVGYFQDDPVLLQSAIEYLRSY